MAQQPLWVDLCLFHCSTMSTTEALLQRLCPQICPWPINGDEEMVQYLLLKQHCQQSGRLKLPFLLEGGATKSFFCFTFSVLKAISIEGH